MVEDLDSAHGTFLNEKRLRGILSLSVGDIIQVGSQTRMPMLFYFGHS